ncbi:MAG: carboxypeptidase regulatory-like domain-containing protein [Gemmatimonadales bacterium]
MRGLCGRGARVAAIAAIAAAALGAATRQGGAQEMHGVVVGPAGVPVPGVVVMLLDSASNTAARALSGGAGRYRVQAPAAGLYRVRTLRIGFRATTSEPVDLRAGQDVARDITVTGIPLALDTIRVVDKGSCRIAADTALLTYVVLEQVRAALAAAQLTTQTRSVATTSLLYERVLQGTSRRIRAQTARVQADVASQPWRSAPAADLHRAGYVVVDGDSTTYFAPGLESLLASSFLDDHCFHIAASADTARLGIAFEPTSRRHVTDIRGTLWVDRKTSELRSMEFGYTHLPAEQAAASGGELEFARMRDGAWVISRWNIRMPVVEPYTWLAAKEYRVVEVHVSGGQLALARRAADTLWVSPPLTVTGIVADSVSGSPIARARVALAGTSVASPTDSAGRFRLESVIPGEYTLEVHTPGLDSIGATTEMAVMATGDSSRIEVRVPTPVQVAGALCGSHNGGLAKGEGAVLGGVRDSSGGTAGAVEVTAEWDDYAVRVTPRGAIVFNRPHALQTRSDARGAFTLCGVPNDAALTLRAGAAGKRSTPVRIRVTPSARVVRVALAIDPTLAAVASFAGAVLADSTAQPLVGAEVSLPDAGLMALTNDQGVFRLTDVPIGEQRVLVRRLGYAPLDQRLTFEPNAVVTRRIVLNRVVVLDSVVVEASSADLPDFEDHRKLGLGHFFTRADLAKRDVSHLDEILETIPSLRIYHDKFQPTKAFVVRSRGAVSLSQIHGTNIDDCYASVYVDGYPVFGKAGAGGEPFDVNTIPPNLIEAIEYYAGPAETPAKYSGVNSTCGVLVIWTRRTP